MDASAVPAGEQQVGYGTGKAAQAAGSLAQFGGDVAWVAPPIVSAYTVSPGSIRNGTAAALGQSQHLVDTYENLKTYINDNKSWIFSVGNDQTIGSFQFEPGSDDSGGVSGYPINDPHPNETEYWSAVSDNLLLQVADAVELGGQYIDALSTAGEIYTYADYQSEPPSLPTVMEGANFDGKINLPPSGF